MLMSDAESGFEAGGRDRIFAVRRKLQSRCSLRDSDPSSPVMVNDNTFNCANVVLSRDESAGEPYVRAAVFNFQAGGN